MYNLISEDYLMHYGVKGMKWGVRHDPERVGRVKTAWSNMRSAQKQANKDYNRAYNYSARHPVSQYFKKSPTYAESNKRWETAQKSAKAYNKAHKDYRTVNIQSKFERKNEKYDKFANKILDARKKNVSKIEAKYDKKINKAKSKELKSVYEGRKAAKVNDFNQGTKMIKKGMNHYKSVNTTYANMKIKALNDPSIKKTKAYKTAGRNYAIQVLGDVNYGKAYTTLDYASKYGQGYKPQKESIKWKR